MRMFARAGIVTRTGAPLPEPPQAASVASVASARTLALRRTLKRMLEQDGRREGIDVAFAALGRAAHLANRAQGGGGGVAFVDEVAGHAGALRQLGGDLARLGRARGIIAV